jgi:hypothetical protein
MCIAKRMLKGISKKASHLSSFLCFINLIYATLAKFK